MMQLVQKEHKEKKSSKKYNKRINSKRRKRTINRNPPILKKLKIFINKSHT